MPGGYISANPIVQMQSSEAQWATAVGSMQKLPCQYLASVEAGRIILKVLHFYMSIIHQCI